MQQTYHDGMQGVYNAFQSTIDAAGLERNGSTQSAYAAQNASYQASQAASESVATSASVTLNSVMNADPGPSADDAKAARLAYDSAIHNAAKQRDSDNAQASHDAQVLAIESARAKSWVDSATARRDAAARWNTDVATPWTAYQLQRATNRLVLAQSLQTAHKAHTLKIADADKSRSEATADADHGRTVALGNQKHDAAPDQIASTKKFRNESAATNAAAAKKSSDDRAEFDEAMTTAFNTRANDGIESYYTYSTTMADAQLAYNLEIIGARRL